MGIRYLIWLAPRDCPHIQEPHQDSSGFILVKVVGFHTVGADSEGEDEVIILHQRQELVNLGIGPPDISLGWLG